MNSAAILLTMAAIGVDVGWQEQKDGSIEYIIQIEPQLVDSLEEGEELTSFIRPELRNIQSYRVVVGSKKLPQNPPLEELQRRWAAEKAAAEAKAAPEKPAPPPFKASDVPAAFQNPPAPLEFPGVPATSFGGNPLEAANPFTAPVDQPRKSDAVPTPADLKAPTPDTLRDEPRATDNASIPPQTFHADSEKPILKHVAGYSDASVEASGPSADETAAEAATVANDETSARPWGVLIAAFLALFASLGLNAFLGWITVEQRGRYRSLISQNRGAESA